MKALGTRLAYIYHAAMCAQQANPSTPLMFSIFLSFRELQRVMRGSDMKNNQATRRVTSGTILLREGVLLPEEIELKTATHSADWHSLPGANGYALDRQLRLVGWSCLFLSGEIRTISFGRSQAAMLKSALRRLLAKVRLREKLQPSRASRFLGIPYLAVCGYARHIQQNYQLDGKEQRRKQQRAIDWARE